MGFPCGSAGKESAYNARHLGLILGLEDPLEKGKATHSSIWPGEFPGLYSPWGRKESDTTEQLSLHFKLKNPGKTTLRHIVIKLTKNKDRGKILKATRKKRQITYKGTSIRLSADVSAETLQARREWHNIFKVLKGKNLQPRILYPARLSFRFDGEIKFSR